LIPYVVTATTSIAVINLSITSKLWEGKKFQIQAMEHAHMQLHSYRDRFTEYMHTACRSRHNERPIRITSRSITLGAVRVTVTAMSGLREWPYPTMCSTNSTNGACNRKKCSEHSTQYQPRTARELTCSAGRDAKYTSASFAIEIANTTSESVKATNVVFT
jgi:hypothetical protein